MSLDMFTSMMASRVESQIRWDWDFNTGLWSLTFASKVNLGVSMSLKRSMRRAEEGPEHTDASIGKAAARLYELLWQGEYEEGGEAASHSRGHLEGLAIERPRRHGADAVAKLPFHVQSLGRDAPGPPQHQPCCIQQPCGQWVPDVRDLYSQ